LKWREHFVIAKAENQKARQSCVIRFLLQPLGGGAPQAELWLYKSCNANYTSHEKPREHPAGREHERSADVALRVRRSLQRQASGSSTNGRRATAGQESS